MLNYATPTEGNVKAQLAHLGTVNSETKSRKRNYFALRAGG